MQVKKNLKSLREIARKASVRPFLKNESDPIGDTSHHMKPRKSSTRFPTGLVDWPTRSPRGFTNRITSHAKRNRQAIPIHNPAQYFVKAASQFMELERAGSILMTGRYEGFAATHGCVYCRILDAWVIAKFHECQDSRELHCA